ncbi:MAG: hypothetical protein Q8O67_25630 [Deltaproteobacteria bacterium]|nr:hypothetical protein [Deltaproteobacteria bacterium]
MAVAAALLLLVAGCGQRRVAADGDVQADHDEARTSVVGTDSNGAAIRGSTPPLSGEDCVIVGDQCLTQGPEGEFCERDGGPYDVIVVDGEVVEVVCYPPASEGDPTLVVDAAGGDVAVPQNENNTTVTFDEDTDGTPIEGDLVIDGNNIAVYGNGVDETIIHGDVVLDGNNVRLRGLTIDGNLTLAKNNLAAVFIKVLGNVVIDGNNCVFTASDVFGSLTVNSNNVVLVQNRVQGAFAAGGNDGACTANAAFTDENGDGDIVESELGDELACD